MCIVCIQRQQEEEMSELTSKLAIKEKEFIKLKDNKKLLSKIICESKVSAKQLETATNKVATYVSIPLQLCVRTVQYYCQYPVP